MSEQVKSGPAELLPDVGRPGGWLLLIDRIRQSYVDLDDPTYLAFECVRNMADILDALEPGALAVTHIGGGACTLARYVAATRPGSSQVVLEADADLVDLVRTRLPLPRGARIDLRPELGRPGLAALSDASADVVVLDAFLDGRVPGELTTREFLADVARVLRPAGTLVANLADGPDLDYTRRVVVTALTVLPHALLIGSTGPLGNRFFANAVLGASRAPLSLGPVRREPVSAEFRTRAVAGPDLGALVAGAEPLSDADPMPSPQPPGDSWRQAQE